MTRDEDFINFDGVLLGGNERQRGIGTGTKHF